jgi:hypothetical protein
MRRWLAELEDYATIIIAMQGSIGSKPHGSIGVSFGSKPPVSLATVAALDPRSCAPDSEEPEPAIPDTVATAVLARDGRQCTWITGLLRGGPYAYLNDRYEAVRRCPAAASGVDFIANRHEFDLMNLRSLCTPHHANQQRRVAANFDPVGWEGHDNVRSLTGSIHGIARWLREERGDEQPKTWTLVSELRYLRTQVDACALEQWVNELHEDLKDLHDQARSMAHDAPRPLAHCLDVECEGMVFWVIKEEGGKRVDEAKCATCQRRYSGTDLVRLGAAEEVAG